MPKVILPPGSAAPVTPITAPRIAPVSPQQLGGSILRLDFNDPTNTVSSNRYTRVSDSSGNNRHITDQLGDSNRPLRVASTELGGRFVMRVIDDFSGNAGALVTRDAGLLTAIASALSSGQGLTFGAVIRSLGANNFYSEGMSGLIVALSTNPWFDPVTITSAVATSTQVTLTLASDISALLSANLLPRIRIVVPGAPSNLASTSRTTFTVTGNTITYNTTSVTPGTYGPGTLSWLPNGAFKANANSFTLLTSSGAIGTTNKFGNEQGRYNRWQSIVSTIRPSQGPGLSFRGIGMVDGCLGKRLASGSNIDPWQTDKNSPNYGFARHANESGTPTDMVVPVGPFSAICIGNASGFTSNIWNESGAFEIAYLDISAGYNDNEATLLGLHTWLTRTIITPTTYKQKHTLVQSDGDSTDETPSSFVVSGSTVSSRMGHNATMYAVQPQGVKDVTHFEALPQGGNMIESAIFKADFKGGPFTICMPHYGFSVYFLKTGTNNPSDDANTKLAKVAQAGAIVAATGRVTDIVFNTLHAVSATYGVSDARTIAHADFNTRIRQEFIMMVLDVPSRPAGVPGVPYGLARPDSVFYTTSGINPGVRIWLLDIAKTVIPVTSETNPRLDPDWSGALLNTNTMPVPPAAGQPNRLVYQVQSPQLHPDIRPMNDPNTTPGQPFTINLTPPPFSYATDIDAYARTAFMNMVVNPNWVIYR